MAYSTPLDLPPHFGDMDDKEALMVLENEKKKKETHPLRTFKERTGKETMKTYDTPAKFEKACELYFKSIDAHNEIEEKMARKRYNYKPNWRIANVIGLADYLGLEARFLINYPLDDEYKSAVELAVQGCMKGLLESAMGGRAVGNVASLAMKNLHKWEDKTSTDVTSGGRPINVVRKSFSETKPEDLLQGEIVES